MKSVLPFLRISSIWAWVIPHRLSFSADARTSSLPIAQQRAAQLGLRPNRLGSARRDAVSSSWIAWYSSGL